MSGMRWDVVREGEGEARFGSGRHGELNTPDLVTNEFGKPERLIRSYGDSLRVAHSSGYCELADLALRSDTPYLVAVVFGEPESSIGSCSDPSRFVSGSRECELADLALEGDTPNFVAIIFGKP